MDNILSYTCINYTYAVVSIAKPTDPCFSEELEELEEQPVRFVKFAYLMQWETIPSFYFPSMWLAKRQKHGQRLSKRHLHLSKKLVITYFFGKISRTDHSLRMSVTNSLTDSQA